MNPFETRMMIRMLEQMLPARTFFRDTFFGNRITATAEAVDIDIRKGQRRVAPYVADKIGSETVERIGFTTKTIVPPLVAIDMITKAEDVKNRQAGETVYGAGSADSRMALILAQDMRDLDMQITRTEEVQAAELLCTGIINMSGEGIVRTVDLRDEWCFDESKNWEDINNSYPLMNFREWRRRIAQSCGLNADIAILGQNAVEWFYLSEEWKIEQIYKRTTFGDFSPQDLPDGVTYIGKLSTGINLFTYDEWAVGKDGKEFPLMDPNKVIIGSTKAYTSLIHGIVYDVARGSFAMPRVPKSWVEEKPSARFIQLSSRPICVPHQLNAFITATVCKSMPTMEQRKLSAKASEDKTKAVEAAIKGK